MASRTGTDLLYSISEIYSRELISLLFTSLYYCHYWEYVLLRCVSTRSHSRYYYCSWTYHSLNIIHNLRHGLYRIRKTSYSIYMYVYMNAIIKLFRLEMCVSGLMVFLLFVIVVLSFNFFCPCARAFNATNDTKKKQLQNAAAIIYVYRIATVHLYLYIYSIIYVLCICTYEQCSFQSVLPFFPLHFV